MKNIILTLLLIPNCILGYAQKNKSSYPNFIGQSIEEVENNVSWNVLLKTFGDLNKDGVKDFSLVLVVSLLFRNLVRSYYTL